MSVGLVGGGASGCDGYGGGLTFVGKQARVADGVGNGWCDWVDVRD